MTKTMHADIAVRLPDDEFEEAAAKLKIKPAFDAFIAALREAGVKFDHELKTIETRTRPGNGGAKRGRKPREQKPAEAAADTLPGMAA